MNNEELTKILDKAKSTGRPICIAHRGASGIAPDCSIEAMRLAISVEENSGIEFDVQQTKDGVIVVMHNFAIQTANGLEYVKDIDFTTFRTLKNEADNPTLKHMLEYLCSYNGIIDIEVKQKNIAKSVINMCKESGLYKNIVFTTLYEDIFDEIRECDPDVAVIYGYPRDRGKNLAMNPLLQPIVRLIVRIIKFRLKSKALAMLGRTNTPFLSFYSKVITPELVKRLHDEGKYCLGATISLNNDVKEQNSISIMQYMYKCDVDGILTDFPNLYNKLSVFSKKS